MQAAIAAFIFAAGGAGGIKWQLGVQARIDLAAADARASDIKRQIKVLDKAAVVHVTTLAAINNKLGDARAHIAKLSDRECFGAATAGLLSSIGADASTTAAGESEGAPAAAASGGGLRFSTERDAAGAIAVCRARYAEVSSQVNQILDIEDARHPVTE